MKQQMNMERLIARSAGRAVHSNGRGRCFGVIGRMLRAFRRRWCGRICPCLKRRVRGALPCRARWANAPDVRFTMFARWRAEILSLAGCSAGRRGGRD